jgi:hypothetical protein
MDTSPKMKLCSRFFLSNSEMKMYLLEKRNEKIIPKMHKKKSRTTRYFKDDFGAHATTHFRPYKEKIKQKE